MIGLGGNLAVSVKPLPAQYNSDFTATTQPALEGLCPDAWWWGLPDCLAAQNWPYRAQAIIPGASRAHLFSREAANPGA
jgi:hypothetical protein